MLTIELVPQTCWFSNLRNAVSKEDWDRLRKEAYKKAGNKCAVCGGRGSKWPVECHEVWEYDDVTCVQKLTGMVALCPNCHEVKHFGRAQVVGRGEEALAHLRKVNGWGRQKASRYVSDVFKTWEERSEHPWKQDLRWATGRVTKWKDSATRKMAIDAGFEEVGKYRRDKAVAEELMEE